MRKILFILMVLVTSAAFGQGVRLKTNIAGFGGAHFVGVPPGYTKLNVRYEFVAMLLDSGLHVPQYNGVPSGVRTGVWVGDGAVAVDTLNGYFYWYSGSAWIKGAKYSDIGAAYTASNGITLSGSNFKLGGTLVEGTTVNTDGNDLEIQGNNSGSVNILSVGSFGVSTSDGTRISVLQGHETELISGIRANRSSYIRILPDTLLLGPSSSNLYIDSLNYTLSATGKKIMLRDTATGLVENIDPSLLSGTVSPGSQGQIYQTSNGAAAWKYDTTTLVTFTAGANFAADTAAFTDSTIYGSFKLMGNDTFYVTGVSAVLYSNNAITDTLGIQITYNDTINVIGSHVFAATYAVNNGTTGQDADGDDFTGSNSVPIPPGNWVWLKSPTVVAGRKPYHMSVSIIGYKKRVN